MNRSPKALGLWLFDGANAHVEQNGAGNGVLCSWPGIL